MPKNNSRQMREFRRTEAEKRQARYDALSFEQKLAQIEERPGESAKEKDRLVFRK